MCNVKSYLLTNGYNQHFGELQPTVGHCHLMFLTDQTKQCCNGATYDCEAINVMAGPIGTKLDGVIMLGDAELQKLVSGSSGFGTGVWGFAGKEHSKVSNHDIEECKLKMCLTKMNASNRQ